VNEENQLTTEDMKTKFPGQHARCLRGFKPLATARKAPARFDAPDVAAPLLKSKNILVPIDFSEESKKAIHYALPLAKQLGATITLLHVTEPISFPADYGYGPVVRQIPDKAAMKKAKARLKGLGQKMIGSASLGETIVLSGDACFEITEAARALEADLIIIGSHGCDGATSTVGSTAEKVFRHATCPVLVVRRKEREFIL
jgi:nucleotide-binding universal stress UspA family protein